VTASVKASWNDRKRQCYRMSQSVVGGILHVDGDAVGAGHGVVGSDDEDSYWDRRAANGDRVRGSERALRAGERCSVASGVD